jgi:hypothetical protein
MEYSEVQEERAKMECTAPSNVGNCSCTYVACDKRGNCCKCVEYHRKKNEIPGCFFTTAGERTWDRSFAGFCRDRGKG